MPYCGLTIVVSHPSRFDSASLFSGYAGSYFIECLSPLVPQACDIRLAIDDSPFINNTKVVLLLGKEATARYIPNDHSLNEQRGCPYFAEHIYIPTYGYQDAMDMKDYEKQFNKLAVAEEDDDGDTKDYGEKTTHGRTSRDNFKFWLRADVDKAKRLLKNPASRITPTINYEIFPSLQTTIADLLSLKDDTLYLDIETDRGLNISCIGFTSDKLWPKVTVVPLMRYTRSLSYDTVLLSKFIHSFSIACLRNTVVVHNSMFDLFVLSWRYGVPFSWSIYDTMLAHSRLAPGVEKSLGHCVSLYTDMPYHKSEGIFEPKTEQQERSLWAYNGKDVAVMPLIKRGIDEAAIARRATDSVKQINDSVYPYLLMTLQGLRYDSESLQAHLAINDRWLNQILRVCKALVGYSFLPSSSQQCVRYFHEQLGHKVVATSRQTGKPSLNEKAFWKLALSLKDHPMIPLCIEYRRLLKQSSTLKFTPWNLTDDYKLCPPNLQS
jgi:hypothetical protein